MFIKFTKLQKWPKEDFALVTRPWWLPVYWQARSLEHASRTYSHATRAWQSGLWSPRGVIEREAQRITFTQLFWQRSTRTCSVQAQTDDCPCGALVMYARGQTQGSQLPVHVSGQPCWMNGMARWTRGKVPALFPQIYIYIAFILSMIKTTRK